MTAHGAGDAVYDCVIIGGGPAGLTAAIFLGRFRRTVLLIDSGEPPRNWASRGIHGFLGYHEIAPSELRARGQAEARAVGVSFLEATARTVRACGDYFEVESSEGLARGRRILFAFGIRDELPDFPRFRDFFGRSIFHCPDCDGYESRDRRIGVIGRGKKVAGLALELLQWSDDITIFTDGEDAALDSVQVSKLQAQGIEVMEETIVSLVGENGVLERVRLRSGEEIACEAIFFTLGTRRACELAEQAGCRIDEERIDVEVDEHGQTSVKGIYAAGDLIAGSQLVIKAAADGAIAAIAINKSLLPPSRKV